MELENHLCQGEQNTTLGHKLWFTYRQKPTTDLVSIYSTLIITNW